EQQHLRLLADLLQLLEHDETVLLIGHQYWRLHALDGQALQGLLEQRLLTGQGEELLGLQLARKRPESRAAATGKDDGGHGCVSPDRLIKWFARVVPVRRVPAVFLVLEHPFTASTVDGALDPHRRKFALAAG